MLQQDREPGGGADDALAAHARLGQAQVQRVVAAVGQRLVDADQLLDLADLAAEDDLLARQPDLFGSPRGAQRALDHGLEEHGLPVLRHRRLGVGLHQVVEQLLVERARVDADAHWLLVVDGALHHRLEVLVVVGALADVAGVDPVFGQDLCALRILPEQQVPVVVEVADDGDVHPHVVQAGLHLRDRRRSLARVDRDPDDLTAGAVELSDLRRRALRVGGVGVGHGLHPHRVAAPDHDPAHADGHGLMSFGHEHAQRKIAPGAASDQRLGASVGLRRAKTSAWSAENAPRHRPCRSRVRSMLSGLSVTCG